MSHDTTLQLEERGHCSCSPGNCKIRCRSTSKCLHWCRETCRSALLNVQQLGKQRTPRPSVSRDLTPMMTTICPFSSPKSPRQGALSMMTEAARETSALWRLSSSESESPEALLWRMTPEISSLQTRSGTPSLTSGLARHSVLSKDRHKQAWRCNKPNYWQQKRWCSVRFCHFTVAD